MKTGLVAGRHDQIQEAVDWLVLSAKHSLQGAKELVKTFPSSPLTERFESLPFQRILALSVRLEPARQRHVPIGSGLQRFIDSWTVLPESRLPPTTVVRDDPERGCAESLS